MYFCRRYFAPLAIGAALGAAAALAACSGLDPTPPVPHIDDPIYPDPDIIVAPLTEPADGGQDAAEDAP